MTKIILFGDSILAGYRDGHTTHLVTNALNQTHLGHFINVSLPGATTLEALDLLDKRVTPDADLVVLFFGTNDCSRLFGIPPQVYQKNLADLISSIGPKRVILVGPSYTNNQIATDHELGLSQQFVIIAKKTAQKFELPFLDIFQIIATSAHPDDFLLEDGIHYCNQGNALFVQELAKLIKTTLANHTSH